MKKRYTIEHNSFGYWIVDNFIPDGERCDVWASYFKKQTEEMCERMNIEFIKEFNKDNKYGI